MHLKAVQELFIAGEFTGEFYAAGENVTHDVKESFRHLKALREQRPVFERLVKAARQLSKEATFYGDTPSLAEFNEALNEAEKAVEAESF